MRFQKACLSDPTPAHWLTKVLTSNPIGPNRADRQNMVGAYLSGMGSSVPLSPQLAPSCPSAAAGRSPFILLLPSYFWSLKPVLRAESGPSENPRRTGFSEFVFLLSASPRHIPSQSPKVDLSPTWGRHVWLGPFHASFAIRARVGQMRQSALTQTARRSHAHHHEMRQ
jgi:hypothetical protein